MGVLVRGCAAEPFIAAAERPRTVKPTRIFYSLRSRLQYASKHFRGVGAAAVWMSTLFAEPLLRMGSAVVTCSWGGRWRTQSEPIRSCGPGLSRAFEEETDAARVTSPQKLDSFQAEEFAS